MKHLISLSLGISLALSSSAQKTAAMVVLFVAGAIVAQAQSTTKKIFFLADTINVDKNNRMIEIGREGPFKYFGFLCRCVKPYHQYPSFSFKPETSRVETFNTRPKVQYISLKDLLGLLSDHGNAFDDHFTLQIVEVLPNKKYQMADNLTFVKQRLDHVVN